MKAVEESAPIRQTFRRLGRIAGQFLRSASGRKAKLFIAALVGLMLCINGLNVLNSYVGRYFMSAIESRDWGGFYRFAWLYAGVFLGQTIIGVFFRFTEERLGLHWREWLTHHVVERYTGQRIYFRLEAAGAITNPDQRISEDVKALTVSTLSFALMIVNGTLTAISFSGVLWSISPTLFAVAVLYAAAGSALTVFFGKPLVRLNYRQSDHEADFRSELIRVRGNAEGIALSDSESLMQKRLDSRIDRLVANFRRIISVNRNLSFFTTGYNYMIQLIPTLLVAPLFMRHGVEFGVIGQSGMAFATLLGAFSLVITQFQSISMYASVVSRLSEFGEACDRAVDDNVAPHIECEMTGDRFAFHNLTVLSADQEPRVLVRELNVSFPPGKTVFVGGSNDAARTTLFHAAAALHDAGSGSIVRPPAARTAFIPEYPYLPPSPLQDLLIGPEVDRVLDEVGLGLVIKKHNGFDKDCDWEDVLSFEERQLMAVARAIIAKPTFVLMDRLESALAPEARKRVLHILAARGIGRVVFGRGSPDPSVHDSFLELHDDGSWAWSELGGKPDASDTLLTGT